MNEPKAAPAAAPASPAKPAKVSGAPAPKPAIEPSQGGGADDWMNPEKLDKMSEAEANEIFSRNWNTRFLGRKSA